MIRNVIVFCSILLLVATGAFAERPKHANVTPIPADAMPRALDTKIQSHVPMNTTCDVGNMDAEYWVGGWLMGEETYSVFVDPSPCGCTPGLVTPTSVSIYLFTEEGIDLCGPITMQADVRTVDWDGGCAVPSDNVVCSSPSYLVGFPGEGGWIVSLPLDPCVALNEPFFISITFPDPVCPELNLVIDDVVEPCNSYNNWGFGWYDLVADGSFIGRLTMYASVECASAIDATIDIHPNTLNLKSKGNYITCYIELPAPYDPANIDVGTVLLNGVIPAEAKPIALGDYDMDGIPDLMVKFSREMLIALLAGTPVTSMWLEERGATRAPLTNGEYELIVSGELMDGTPFVGSDVIRVINPGGGNDDAAPALTQALEVYPTPVAGTAMIKYQLDVPGEVSLRVFDAAGRMVRAIESGHKDAGTHNATWDRKTDAGQVVGPGVYFIRLDKPGGMKMQKLLVVQ